MPNSDLRGAIGTAPAQCVEAMAGGSAEGGPPVTVPTQDERLFAALAYLSYLVGFWVIGPLVIYAAKGRRSAFVRFHAGQALIATLGVLAAMMIGIVIYVVASFVGFALFEVTRDRTLGVVLAISRVALLGVLAVVPSAVLVLCAIPAYRGRTRRVPLVGRFASRLDEPLFRAVDRMLGGQAGGVP